MRVSAQERRVAITVDDLPYARGSMPTANEAEARAAAKSANAKLLAAFQAHHVPVTGFVIQKSVESLGPPAGAGILQEWIADGFDLGNHTYSHRDLNGLSPEQMEQEILEGESTIRPLMERAGKRIAFLRFPFNHTGDTKLKHDAVAAFLGQHGYRVATCTIDTSDYDFNNAYVRMLANIDKASARKLREEYLAYTSTEIDYYAALNKQVLGYDPPEVMLLHDNRLNADTIGEVLRLFEEKGYRFVSLEAAQSDAAYHIPETYITKFGPMWGYRWARERNVKVNGSLEPDPPKWISDYGKAGTR
ncbi:MAG TPA: polysaccharide deacetylase family protein [Bryobacteraceae bacterium]|nr:polysaccharide deacetylase family protein [Bryobacteraceae bacterium]